jgi:hypothetical protein
MKQQRQNVRSTKVRQNTTNSGGGDDDECNDQIKPQTKAKDVYIKIYLANDTVHFDQTGRFPATSSRGNKYIMVLVEIDGNDEEQNRRVDDQSLPGVMGTFNRNRRCKTNITHHGQ